VSTDSNMTGCSIQQLFYIPGPFIIIIIKLKNQHYEKNNDYPVIAGLILISVTGFSQTALKIGHVDIAEILAALPERDSAAVVIDKEDKGDAVNYDDMTAVYNRMLDDYEKELSNLFGSCEEE